MDVPRETCSDINELQIVSHEKFCTDEISLFSPVIFMSAFRSRSFNENVDAINFTNNVRGFALILGFKYFSSNRCFDSSHGEINVITVINVINVILYCCYFVKQLLLSFS